jgi:hypothetical protein
MSKKNPTHFPLVLIVWDDHTSNDAWIKDGDAAKETGVATIHSVGWLTHEDKKSYTIVSAIDLSDGTTGVAQTILKAVSKKTVLAK